MAARVVTVEDAVGVLVRRATASRGDASRAAERGRAGGAAPRAEPATLAALSGIDGSGKGLIAGRIAAGLREAGLEVAPIALDPWHHPARIRFARDSGAHFYSNAFRFDELFERLIEPLRRDRSIELEARLLDLPTDATYQYTYRFEHVNVILIEGIFLLRRDLRSRYDVTLWIDCPFEVALERALRRNQEATPAEQIRSDYERIYFPAQRLHLALDDPPTHADLVLENG